MPCKDLVAPEYY